MAAKTSPAQNVSDAEAAENARLAKQHAEMDAMMDSDSSRELANGNSKRNFDDAALASITDFATAMEAVQSVTNIETFDDYGNGFTVLDTKDKKQLEGVPFIIVEWRNNMGDNGEFVSMAIVTKDGRKLIVNDGSLGIRDQLKSVQQRREAEGKPNPQTGLLCERGLKGASYTTTINGQEIKATTYRIA